MESKLVLSQYSVNGTNEFFLDWTQGIEVAAVYSGLNIISYIVLPSHTHTKEFFLDQTQGIGSATAWLGLNIPRKKHTHTHTYNAFLTCAWVQTMYDIMFRPK